MPNDEAGPNRVSPLQQEEDENINPAPVQLEMQEMTNTSTRRHYLKTAYIIVVDLINLLMAAGEIALALYLTFHHFKESMGVIAVVILAPIILNFVGVTYFLSDERERMVFEKVGTSRLAKDLFQVPVLGPVFTAFEVFLISSGISKHTHEEYEMFEASAVKMRQAQTFFSSAPEAIVQLSLLLISREPEIMLHHILEILTVLISFLTLAESNVYALRSPYFRLFHKYKDGDWEVHEKFKAKYVLFFHSFFSIGSRILASASLIAAVQCYSLRNTRMRLHNKGMPMPMMPSIVSIEENPSETVIIEETPQILTEQLGFLIGLSYIVLIMYYIVLYYIARMLRYLFMGKEVPGGCYESINYGWRSTILNTGFQSRNAATQLWFYFENCGMFALWWISLENYGHAQTKQNTQIPMTIIFSVFTIFSICFFINLVTRGLVRLRSPFKLHPKLPAPREEA